jgi:hypothetical protein
MSLKPPTRAMRANPDLDQLKRQAKELLEAYRASSPEALAEVAAYHRTATPETFALHDAQFVLARSYGFESWPKLKAAVDGVTATKLHESAESGELETARQLLNRRPEIVDLARGEMRALHMAVLRRDLEMTKLLLDFGADPDGGIWPNRDATSPYVIARDRGYEEIVAALETARRTRGARGPDRPTEATRELQRAHQSDSDEAMVGWTALDFAASGRGGHGSSTTRSPGRSRNFSFSMARSSALCQPQRWDVGTITSTGCLTTHAGSGCYGGRCQAIGISTHGNRLNRASASN